MGLALDIDPTWYESIDHAAFEAVQSRLYGGIHYGFDNHDGYLSGRCVGHAILSRVQFERSAGLGDLHPGILDNSTMPPTWRPIGDGRLTIADVIILLRAVVGLLTIDDGD